jgi:hypothetical protein
VSNPTPAQATAGPAAYPPEITAGTSYSYPGSGTVTAFASDRRDVGTSACAGINESTQVVPAGYIVYFFVAIKVPDGNILSAGYIKTSLERHDFGSLQRTDGSRDGVANAAGTTTPGSHTYCVTHTAGGWTMTDDGTTIFTTAAESASSTSGGEVRFQNSASVNPSQPPTQTQSFNLVVVKWHDLAVGGSAPTQLTGSGRQTLR